ncbi:MAG: alkaline shock response membrane anchor protein AmaP [Anaerolineae bacterium]|nr:alkaline shock response membrane anchor protein AmaP [Anaerolineae bacterium]
MNIFNRIVLVLLLLGLMIISTIIFIFPDQILGVVGHFLIDWGEYFAWVNQEQPVMRLVISISLAFVVDLILLLLIFLEVKPKRKRFIKVERANGGKATVSIDSIVRQLLYKLDPLPGVVKVTPTIHPKGDKILARIDVVATRELAVPQLADQLITTAKEALSEDLGLVIAGEPQVRMRIIDGVRQSSALPPSPSTTAPPQPLDTPGEPFTPQDIAKSPETPLKTDEDVWA